MNGVVSDEIYADVAAAYSQPRAEAKALVLAALYGDPTARLLMEAARITAAGARGEL